MAEVYMDMDMKLGYKPQAIYTSFKSCSAFMLVQGTLKD